MTAASDVEHEIVLDLSRLVSRVLHHTPTGVDRVEMAYARGLLAMVPERLRFGAVHPSGRYGRVPSDAAVRFLDRVSARWESDRDEESNVARYRHVADALWTMRPRHVPSARVPRVFLQTSPNHLLDLARMQSMLGREQARFVCLLHDIIPVTHPEYARPGGDRHHLQRIRTIAATADAVIANSHATMSDFALHLAASGRVIATLVAHLGFERGVAVHPTSHADRPYFVCLGTIEPRKNHLLLLHIWRDLAARLGADAMPKLLIIGRRGWENEQVLDMLERCPSLEKCVEEHHGLPDSRMRALLAGARALLLPSFAEGFGMPVPEALACGVPVLCSDLPALREAGGEVPDYLDPLDGPAWRRAVLDYANPDSAMRAAQIDRLGRWLPTTWEEHLVKVLDLLHRLPR